MSSSVKFNIINRKAKTLAMKLPLRYTFAEMGTIEASTPGTLDAIDTAIGLIAASFVGGSKVQDGNYSGFSVGFSTPTTSSVPTIQTHEERVVLTYQVTFPDSVVELHKYSLPTPDLDTDWPFPSGTDRVYAADMTGVFSAGAVTLTDNVGDFLGNYGFDGATLVTLLYVDLVGRNS